MMKLLIDTNAILDYLADRAPFADHAERVFELREQGKIVGAPTSSAAIDIYYNLRKGISHEQALEHIKLLLTIIGVAEVGKNDLLRALYTEISDFENTLTAPCAKRIKADYVVTQDIKDFSKSAVPPLSPEDFLNKFFPL